MTKKSAKIIALLLAVIMTAAMFAGCAGNDGKETTAPVETTAPGTTVPGETTTAAAKDMGGYEFVLVNSGNFNPEGALKGSSLGEELNAIYENIEDTYNCTFTFSAAANDRETLYASVTSGTKHSDFVRIRQSTWIPLAVNKCLRPLDTAEMVEAGLDVNDADSFYQHYTHLSDFTVDGVKNTWAVDMSGKFDRMAFGHTYAFNKNLLESNGYATADVFKLVYDMKWTYEKMIEIATAVTKDTNGDGVTDVWGIALDCDGNEIWTNGTGPILYNQTSGKYEANCKDPNVLKSLEFMSKLNSNGTLSPALVGDATMGRGDRRTLFYSGKAGFAGLYGPNFGEDGTTNGTAFMEDAAGLLPIPKGPDTDHYTMNFVDVDVYCMLVSVSEWQKAAFIMGKLGDGLHDDQEYFDYLKEESLLGCPDSYKILTEYLLPNGLMNIAKCSDNMYTITRQNFYKSVYDGSMTPAQAAETFNPQVQAELDTVFHQGA